MRKTGHAMLGDASWGRHVALFYARKVDLLEICVPFLKAGLDGKEFCVWVVAEPLTEEEAKGALRQTVPALDQHLINRRIEISQSRAWYFTGDTPDLQKAQRRWEEKLADALARGYEGTRVAAHAPRLEAKDWEDFFRYEAQLNEYLSGKAMLVLCAYPLAEGCQADVARTHPSVVVKQPDK